MTESQSPLPNMMSQPKKPLKPMCLAIARLRPNESTALAMKESHLFPTWWANPQKTSETSVFGNSAASTYWKRSSCNERESPLPNMMSQPTKKPLKPVCLAIAWLRPNESTVLAMKESHLFPTWWANPQKPLKPVCLALARLRPNESTALAMKESHLCPA